MKAHRYFQLRCLAAIVLGILLSNCRDRVTNSESNTLKIDSLIRISEDFKLRPDQRLRSLKAAFNQNMLTNDDSLRMVYFNKISYLAASQSDTSFFLTSARKGRLLANKRQDSVMLGHIHWNYGIYFLRRNQLDSSYYHYRKAYKIFENRDDFYAGKMLYNMAFISGRLKEYTTSEALLYRAIPHFENLGKYKQLYLCYNHLGVVHKNLEEFDEALKNYETALKYWKRTKRNSVYFFDTQNNIGMVYQKLGLQKDAIESFDRVVFSKDIVKLDPSLYARVLDNKAMSMLLWGEFKGLPNPFYKALRIRDSIGNKEGLVMSHLHLSQYYLAVGDTAKAREHARNTYYLANKINLKRDALEALLLLAKSDVEQESLYLAKHISLNNELNIEERRLRNKFARIQFETDSYIDKNEKLERTWFWTIVGSLFLITILILIVVLLKQRSKTKELEFEVKQQLADEQIYLLTLKEIANLEKGKLEERRRISEELHDGILARMLVIRLNWERLKIEGTKDAISEHKNCLHHLDLVEREIRKISHDLQNEIRLQDTRFVRWMEQLVKERSVSGDFEYKFYADASVDWEGFDDYFKANVYRMVEEALQNCIKHAEAGLVSISLKKWGNFVEIEIRDNGKGFVKPNGNNGIGVKNMISRTKKLKGIFTINSVVGEGTVIQILIPNNDDL